MAEPMSSAVAMLTDFFSADHIEASARRTGFVQRASKITGQLLLALVTCGHWREAKTTFAQLAAKVTQVGEGGEVSPEASPQRLNSRALAFLPERSRTAVAKLHVGHTVGEESLLAPFTPGPIADSTGLGLPDSLKDRFPGAGGSAAPAGATMHLVWE